MKNSFFKSKIYNDTNMMYNYLSNVHRNKKYFIRRYDVLKCSEQNKLHYFSLVEFFIISTDDIFTKQDAFTLTSNEIFVATDAFKAI